MLQFINKHVVIVKGIWFTSIKQKNQDPSSFNVPQKLVTKSFTFMGSFYKTRDVSENKSFIVAKINDPEVWLEGSKWIISDLWSYCGQT